MFSSEGEKKKKPRFLKMEAFSGEHTLQFLDSSFTRSWMHFWLIAERETLTTAVISECQEPLHSQRQRFTSCLKQIRTLTPEICPNYWTFLAGANKSPYSPIFPGERKSLVLILSQFWTATICETEKPFVAGGNHFAPSSIFKVKAALCVHRQSMTENHNCQIWSTGACQSNPEFHEQ